MNFHVFKFDDVVSPCIRSSWKTEHYYAEKNKFQWKIFSFFFLRSRKCDHSFLMYQIPFGGSFESSNSSQIDGMKWSDPELLSRLLKRPKNCMNVIMRARNQTRDKINVNKHLENWALQKWSSLLLVLKIQHTAKLTKQVWTQTVNKLSSLSYKSLIQDHSCDPWWWECDQFTLYNSFLILSPNISSFSLSDTVLVSRNYSLFFSLKSTLLNKRWSCATNMLHRCTIKYSFLNRWTILNCWL